MTGSIPVQGLDEYACLSIGLKFGVFTVDRLLVQKKRNNITVEITYDTRRYLKYSYDKGTGTGLTFLESVTGFQHCTKNMCGVLVQRYECRLVNLVSKNKYILYLNLLSYLFIIYCMMFLVTKTIQHGMRAGVA